jgi:type VI secretion system secreted protein Hcp
VPLRRYTFPHQAHNGFNTPSQRPAPIEAERTPHRYFSLESLAMSTRSKRTKPIAAAIATSLALAFTAPASAAAVDYFLKIDGIKGESVDKDHKDEIQIESWSWGAAQSSTGASSGRSSGKSCAQEINFTKLIDKSSPLLAAGVMSGGVIPNAVLIGRKSGGDKPVEFLQYEMKNVLISSYSIAGSNSSLPMDSFSLNFASVTIEYKTQKPDGSAGDPTRVSFQGGC